MTCRCVIFLLLYRQTIPEGGHCRTELRGSLGIVFGYCRNLITTLSGKLLQRIKEGLERYNLGICRTQLLCEHLGVLSCHTFVYESRFTLLFCFLCLFLCFGKLFTLEFLISLSGGVFCLRAYLIKSFLWDARILLGRLELFLELGGVVCKTFVLCYELVELLSVRVYSKWAVQNLTDTDKANNDDMFALAANLKFDGFSGAVYAAYAALDNDEAYKAVDLVPGIDKKFPYKAAAAANTGWNDGRPAGEGDAYWVGFTSTMSFFDPFTLKLSAAYGTFEAQDSANDTDGWNVQAKASYKTAFGTPVLGGWYFSGKDEDGEGYMPNAGYFAGTNHLYDGYACLVNPSMANNDGTWAVQAGIEGVSFLSGLSHDFHVTYMKGTNDEVHAGDVFLTEDDAVVEFTLNNVYKMYKNLSVRLELAYVINDFGDATKAANGDEDDWFAGLTFDFRF